MKKRLVSSILTAVMVTSIFAGCGDGFLKAAGAENSGEAMDINFLTMSDTADDASSRNIGKERLAEYQEANPHVNLVNNSMAQGDYNTKIKAIIAGGDLPDIFSTRGYSMIQPAIDSDQMYTAEELLAQIDGWAEMFPEGIFDDFAYKGEYWAIPIQSQNCGYLFANMNILNEVGIEKAPTTWDELKAAIAATKEAGYIPLASGNRDKFAIADCVGSWLCDRYCTTEWFNNIKEGTGEARFTDQCFIDALTTFTELVDMGAFNADANSLPEDQGQALYASGKAAMFFSGGWACNWVEKNCSEDIVNATACVLPPSIPDTPGAQNGTPGGSGWGYCVPKSVTGEKLQEVCEILYYLTDYTFAEYSIDAGYATYPSKTPEGADLSNFGPVTIQYINSINVCTITPDYVVLLEPSTLEVYQNVFQELMVGMVTPEEGAKKIDDTYQMYFESLS